MNFEHIDTILNFVLFTSTSALTLLGLISLFTSFNVQNKVQRLTETLSNIESLNEITNYESIEPKFTNLMAKYERIYSLKQDIEFKIIKSIKTSIYMIISIWCSCLIVLIPKFYLIEWIYVLIVAIIVIIVLLKIIKLIDKLLNIKEISYLPTVKELLDLSRPGNSFMLLLIAKTAVIYLMRVGDEVEVKIGLPINVENFTVATWIHTYEQCDDLNDNIDYTRLDETEFGPKVHSIKLDNGSFNLTSHQVFYHLEKIKYSDIKRKLIIQLDMGSRIAFTTSHYSVLKTEIEDSILLLPKNARENLNYENSVVVPRSDSFDED